MIKYFAEDDKIIKTHKSHGQQRIRSLMKNPIRRRAVGGVRITLRVLYTCTGIFIIF